MGVDEILDCVNDVGLKRKCLKHTNKILLFKSLFGLNGVGVWSDSVLFYDSAQVMALCIGPHEFDSDPDRLLDLFNPDRLLKLSWFLNLFVEDGDSVCVYARMNQPIQLRICSKISFQGIKGECEGNEILSDFFVCLAPMVRVE